MVAREGVLAQLGRYLALGFVALTMLFPLVWMFRVAFMLPSDATDLGSLASSTWTFQNFRDLFTQANLGRALFNSVLVGGVVTVGNIIFCFMAAFSDNRNGELHTGRRHGLVSISCAFDGQHQSGTVRRQRSLHRRHCAGRNHYHYLTPARRRRGNRLQPGIRGGRRRGSF